MFAVLVLIRILVPKKQNRHFLSAYFAAKYITMEIKIRYEDIIERCEKLSSFEAEGKVDANGKSRYLEIHINEVDKLLITDYIKQARYAIEERISKMITWRDDFIVENITEAGPEFIGRFDAFIPDDSTMQYYHIMDKKPEDCTISGDIVFLNRLGKFAYRIATRPFGKPATTTGYTVFTDMSSVGLDNKTYSYESNVKKAYYYTPTYEKMYTWNKDGNELVDYSVPETVLISYEGLVWSIRTDTRWKGSATFVKHITEAIVAYTMAAWLRGRLDERVAFYENLYNNTLSLAVKNIFTKQAPK